MPKYMGEPIYRATLLNGKHRFAVSERMPDFISQHYWANSYEEAIRCYEEEYCAPNDYHPNPFKGKRSFGVTVHGFVLCSPKDFADLSDEIWE